MTSDRIWAKTLAPRWGRKTTDHFLADRTPATAVTAATVDKSAHRCITDISQKFPQMATLVNLVEPLSPEIA
ncbi:hypothetical protein H6F75_14875 [Nodosilinea sp. FACHB-131]|nr:hypothetical protein [Nodosilinea sp. FACHB-131]